MRVASCPAATGNSFAAFPVILTGIGAPFVRRTVFMPNLRWLARWG